MITLLQQAEQYRKFTHEQCQAHHALANRSKQLHVWLGILVVLFATAALFIFFSAETAQKTNALEMAIAGLMLILAAVLTAVLISFRLSAITKRHSCAASEYDAISYRLSMFLLFYPDLRNSDARQFALKEMNDIIERITKISRTAPALPGKMNYDIKVHQSNSVSKEQLFF